jgi:hypothetical protein
MVFGDYRYLAELARIVIAESDWMQKSGAEGNLYDEDDLYGEDNIFDEKIVCVLMGLSYQFAGDPVRALDSYGLLDSGKGNEDDVVFTLFLQSMALGQHGCLANAERCARAALAQPVFLDGFCW